MLLFSATGSGVGSVSCVGFLIGGTGACVLVVELGLFPLMSRAMSDGVFWGVCELSMTLGSLCADRWVCVPILFVFGVRHPALGAAGSWVEPGLRFR